MKYIKFKENHKSNVFQKGNIVKIEDAVFEAWMESGIVAKSTKKEYDNYVGEENISNESKVEELKKETTIEEKKKD